MKIKIKIKGSDKVCSLSYIVLWIMSSWRLRKNKILRTCVVAIDDKPQSVEGNAVSKTAAGIFYQQGLCSAVGRALLL